MNLRSGILLFVLMVMGCASHPPIPDLKGPLQFIDLASFDAQLRQAIAAKPDTVQIVFIDNVKPSQLPDRLKPWVDTLQNVGGDLTVVPPPGDLRPGAFPLLGLLPSLWSLLGNKNNDLTLQESLRGYDVQILLKETDAGDRLVQSIVFKRR